MILFCKCVGTDIIQDEERNLISGFLANSGLEYIEVSDFCDQATIAPDWLEKLKSCSYLAVIACYPRALNWLFHVAGIPKKVNIKYFNLREHKAAAIIAELKQNSLLNKGCGKIIDNDNRPFGWFPVIDYDRCTFCGQCMDFCLFGVYERMPDKSIKVVKPANCKDNCPACARICPHVAIMFPKLKEKPINGAEVGGTDNSGKNLKLDFNDMLGDDAYAALAARKVRARKNLLKSQDLEKAETEKNQCSCKCESSEAKGSQPKV